MTGLFKIRDKSAGSVIGSTRFYSYDALGQALRLGYTFLCRTHWSSSANKEMKEVLVEYAFPTTVNVYFDIGKEKFHSRKAVEKLGAVECAGGDDKAVCGSNKVAFSHRE